MKYLYVKVFRRVCRLMVIRLITIDEEIRRIDGSVHHHFKLQIGYDPNTFLRLAAVAAPADQSMLHSESINHIN